VVLFLFEPDRRCDIGRALAYVELISENALRVIVLEGDYKAFDMKRRNRRCRWVNIAHVAYDGL
jgi:hypothetical protein